MADSVFVQVTNSYAVGSVSGAQSTGGLAGAFTPGGNKAPFYFVNFTNSFARVSFPGMGAATTSGRLFGFLSGNKTDSQASSVYYDAGYAPGTALANAVGSGSLQGLTGAALTSTQFTSAASFSGWDFTIGGLWTLSNGAYPTLQGNPE